MILIDTHAWIWFNSDPSKLSEVAVEHLEREKQIAISSISIYETMVAIEKGRLITSHSPETLVRRWLSSFDVKRIPVSEEIVIQSRTLSFILADPFDRMIAGTAVCEKVPLMTADRNLLSLDWLATIPAQ